MSNWYLIENAPKDGTWVLMAGGGYLGEYRNPTHWMPLPIYQPLQKREPVYLECGE